ncbi:carboxylesterase/lipase family protein [Archangium lipolyticum]|uniref:carboxylesterase/lipase family protein n=1 Tax=Archangium lipolyticum TaxID=2970465 RepID=UPI002149E33B|nr:carboxylesterase family protein [Archangium lipolyticum]
MKSSRVMLAALTGVLSGCATVPRATESHQVRVSGGLLQGAVRDGVLSFKGIPFAAPPVGDLRWRPPQPVQQWSGVRQATAFGHDCMQVPFAGDAAPLGTPPAEDCLTLNVWRPADAPADGKLPVMVWIYGGGFVNGGASPSVYDGSRFARQGLVLVSFNYRLGRLGFFAHPALTAEAGGAPTGNFGYMDQIAALEWVRDNIAAFGGDPENVTVFGESAGGASVHTLLTSPKSRELFHKAIIMSGGGRGPLLGGSRLSEDTPGGPRSAESIGVEFARSVGIQQTGPEALAALRALPVERLGDLSLMTMNVPTYSGPMLDGQLVVEWPDAAYRAGRWARVPVMVGATSADIGFGFARTKDEVFTPFPDKAAARATYDPAGTADVRTLVALTGMDRLMLEPARFTARVAASQGVPSWHYRFSYVADSMRDEWKTGAPHATEIPYMFDTVGLKYEAKTSERDRQVARAANAYFANFARTGDPNGQGLPPWPRYEPTADVLLDFSASGEPVARPDPWKARLDVTEAAAEAASK